MARIRIPLRDEVTPAFYSLRSDERARLMRSLRERIAYHTRKKKRNSIFISHSRGDLDRLVRPAAFRIRCAGFEAYVASLRVAGKNPAEKILEAISSSRALFAIITQNVTGHRETRDWVLFEIGAAKSLDKPVFGWKTARATVPEPIKQITDYSVFDSEKPKEVKQMLDMIGNQARSLRRKRG